MNKLLLLVTYTVPGTGRDFVAAIKAEGLDEIFRAEDGCIKYDYYFAENSAHEVLLYEVWENAEKQQAHCQTENFRRLSLIKEKFAAEVKIEKYSI